MDISVFTALLQKELTMLGVETESADNYIFAAWKGLSSADVADATEADIKVLAKLCAAHITATSAENSESGDKTPASDNTEEALLSNVFTDAIEEDASADQIETLKDTTEEDPTDIYSLPNAPDTDNSGHQSEKKKRTSLFVLITALSSPLWLIAAVLFFLPFAVIFAAELAVTVSLVCLLAAFAALGTAASFTGIVYGIIKLFSALPVGLYEIGFGIIIAGVTMIFGILIYNGTVRFMPWLFKKTGMFFKFVFLKVKPLLKEYKRRCESL